MSLIVFFVFGWLLNELTMMEHDIPYYPRIIWSYWEDIKNLPEDVEESIDVTRSALDNFTHILLTEKNLSYFLNVFSFPSFYKELPGVHRGDYVRICLVEKYGGVYIDSSTYVTSNDAMEWFFFQGIQSKKQLFGFGVKNRYIYFCMFGGSQYSQLLSEFKKKYDEVLTRDAYDYCEDVVFKRGNKKRKRYRTQSNYECFNYMWKIFVAENPSLKNTVLIIPQTHSMSINRLRDECHRNKECIADRLLHDPKIRSYPFIKLIHKFRLGKKIGFFRNKRNIDS